MVRPLARLFSEFCLGLVALALGVELLVRVTPAPDLSRAQPRSQLVMSQSGQVLWGFLAPDDKWRLSSRRAEVDPRYIRILIGYEDRRFLDHNGVDGFALVRAAIQFVRQQRVVSGGSTLTMQVVRMLDPRPRTLAAKLDQILRAIRLERVFGKEQILELYLAMAPFGGNIEGVRAASLAYLGKEPKRLSLAEAALLAAVPQSPEALRPDRNAAAARAARNRVLASLAARGILDTRASSLAMRDSAPSRVRPLTRHAPHLAARMRMRVQGSTTESVTTLLDGDLQAQVEQIAGRAITRWDDGVNIAIIVIRNYDASVAAYLGGVDLHDRSRRGHVDLVQGIRSPGSALKPLIYAMAFERLIVHPETIITDQPIEIAGYRPENSDGLFSGDISVRQALIRSRNTTAVMLLERLGIDNFLARFRSAGRPLYLPASERTAGLAVALGGVGVTLEQLTWFYSALANEGTLRSLRFMPADPSYTLGQLVTPAAARATADILADVPPPAGYARQHSTDDGRRLGFKTGTSYGFRDAWAVGFDQLHTVGVWVGRADGAAHLGAYGVTAAAPIMMQVFDRLPVPRHDAGSGRSEVGALSSLQELPRRLARFDERDPAQTVRPLEITFPRNGSTVRTDRFEGASVELPVVSTGGRPPYRWTFSGKLQPSTHASTSRWSVEGRGQFEVSIIDSAGTTARSSFWLD